MKKRFCHRGERIDDTSGDHDTLPMAEGILMALYGYGHDEAFGELIGAGYRHGLTPEQRADALVRAMQAGGDVFGALPADYAAAQLWGNRILATRQNITASSQSRILRADSESRPRSRAPQPCRSTNRHQLTK